MLTEIFPGIFVNPITLPKNPLRSLNCYLIPGEERSLIIDTGFNQPECRDDFLRGIRELQIDLSKTDLLLTHLHSDHIGLANLASEMGARILAGEFEGPAIHHMATEEYWRSFDPLLKLYGLEEFGITVADHPGYRYRPDDVIEYTPLRDGDTLAVGNYLLKVIDTPGHTLGHISLYLEEHRLLFSGDHVLGDITPNIVCWGPEKNALGIYLENLKKVREFNCRRIFPAHRAMIDEPQKRIDELLAHHKARLAEVEQIIADRYCSSADIAAGMTWDLRIEKWLDFPKAQKWFSTGEAMAHLEHLFFLGKAEREDRNGTFYYKKK